MSNLCLARGGAGSRWQHPIMVTSVPPEAILNHLSHMVSSYRRCLVTANVGGGRRFPALREAERDEPLRAGGSAGVRGQAARAGTATRAFNEPTT